MPIGEAGINLFNNISAPFFIKTFFVLFLIFNTIFSFVLMRQVHIMGRTLMTPLVPLIRFISIVYIGVTLALLFIVIGAF